MTHLIVKNFNLCINGQAVCTDLNFTLHAGDTLGVLGANGIGKTTLLRAFNRLHSWHSGDVIMNQSSIKRLSRQQLAQSIGLLLQGSIATFPQRVIDCVKQGSFSHTSNAPAEQLKKIMQQFDLTELANRSITELSGGEQRRVDLATLWLQNPLVTLLDEPFNQLDFRHQQMLCQLLKTSRQQKRITVISSHHINLVRPLCNKILLLFGEGRYLFGSRDEIINQNNLEKLYQCKMTETHCFSPLID